MIEAGLYIAAGFLGAVLIAMIVAPTIWRRAVYLTRRRIEEAVPLTVSELQADKDRLRARHAVAEKKLELALRRQRGIATGHAAQVSDLTETLKLRDQTIAAREATMSELRASLDQLGGDLARAQSELSATQLDLDTANVSLSARAAELDSTSHLKAGLERQLTEAHARIEEQARAIERLEGRLGEVREKLRAQQALVRRTRAEAKQTAQLLKTERAVAADLEERHARVIEQASDVEEALVRREKDIARLREARAGEEADLHELEQRALDARHEHAALESELGAMTVRFERLARLLGDREPEAAIAAYEARIARLETDLASERRHVAGLEAAAAGVEGDAVLREQIAMLAAQIVHMAAVLEGEGSPVPELVARAGAQTPGRPVSLAARIAALQSQAARARPPDAPSPAAPEPPGRGKRAAPASS